MSDLPERLRSWAQNEEMIDQYYTAHGRDCNAAAEEIERLRARERELKGEWETQCERAQFLKADIERLLKLVHEQDAERRRDALDGQAALDEAGNEINRLTEHCGRQEREIEKRGAEIERLRTGIDRLRDMVEDARLVIERGVELMTNEQVGHWEGVRTWLELEAPEVSDE